jgi:hypothetical protein
MADESKVDAAKQTSGWYRVLVTTVGTVLGLASFFTILGLMLANLYPGQSLPADGEPPVEERLRELKTDDQQKLTTYHLIDAEKGIWRIPIDVAMEKMITEATETKEEGQ